MIYLPLERLYEEISRYLWECNKIIHKKGHKIATEYGLTYDQYHLLIYLKKLKTPPTINDISDKLNLAQNTVSEKISRMEEKGLVSRIDDDNDRRITRVLITGKGLDLIEIIKKEKSNRITYSALSKLDEEEVNNLLLYLEKLYISLQEGDYD